MTGPSSDGPVLFMILIVFNLLLLAACGYALLRGGRPEQTVAAMLLAAALATFLVHMPRDLHFWNAEIETLGIDVALLAGLGWVALRANRFWPLWMFAIHASAVAVHLSKLIDPTLLAGVYAIAATVSSFPMMALLVAGAARHRRRMKRTGSDMPWNGFSLSSTR